MRHEGRSAVPGSIHLIAAAASVALSAPAAVPPNSSQEIIVDGKRIGREVIDNFMQAVTPAHVGGQLSRFETAVCPAATGLSDAQNRRVTERLRAVAEAAGIPLAPHNCGPNALLIVVGDKEAFIKAMKHDYPSYFAVSGTVGGKLPHEPGPATAWHIQGMMTADHMPAPVGAPFIRGVMDGQYRTGDRPGGNYFITNSTDSSRIRPPTIPDFLGGVVVVERRSLAGLSTTQLADYAAMRLYATTDPTKLKPSASSILGVLDAPMGAEIPLSLTSWDLGFLKGLYRVDDRQYANRQRDQIERSVRKEVGAER
jgi:hypothetical protein